MASQKNIPKGDIIWVTWYNNNDDIIYVITSKQIRDVYFLYEIKDGDAIKIGKNASPIVLEDTFIIKGGKDGTGKKRSSKRRNEK